MTDPTTSELIERLKERARKRDPVAFSAGDHDLVLLAASRLADLEREREELTSALAVQEGQKEESYAHALAAERSLAEAEGVIEPFAVFARGHVQQRLGSTAPKTGEIMTIINSLGEFSITVEHLDAARAFLNSSAISNSAAKGTNSLSPREGWRQAGGGRTVRTTPGEGGEP